MNEDLRRATGMFLLSDASGGVVRRGDGEAVIADGSLSIGTVTVSLLDVDAMRTSGYSIELQLWPSNRLTLSQLGRRFDTFASELRRSRNDARVAGLLAHGIGRPEVYEGALLGGSGSGHAGIQIFDTHVTLVPEDDDPFQLPLGAVAEVRTDDNPPRVIVDTGELRVELGQLGRQRDECCAAISRRIADQSRVLTQLTGHDAFMDGRAVARDRISGFDQLLKRVTSPDRLAAVPMLLSAARSEPRLGFVQMVDREEHTSSPPALPD